MNQEEMDFIVRFRNETQAGFAKLNSDLSRMQNQVRRGREEQRKFNQEQRTAVTRLREMASTIAVIDGPLGGIASRFNALGTLISRAGVAGAGFALGLTAVGVVLHRAVDAAVDAEKQFFRLDVALRNAGEGVGQTRDSLEALAQSVGIGTLASTQEVRNATVQLLSFGTVTGTVFEDAIRLSQDMAELGFGNLTSNAVRFGRALSNPIDGITQLTRAGVIFTDETKEQIRTLVEQNRLLEAQQAILEVVRKRVGGSGVGAAQSISGSWDTFNERLKLGLETLGKYSGIIEGFKFVLDGLNRGIVDLQAGIEDVSTVTDTEVLNRQYIEAGKRRSELVEQLRKAEESIEKLSKGNARQNRTRLVQAAALVLSLKTQIGELDALGERILKRNTELKSGPADKNVTLGPTEEQIKAIEAVEKQINIERTRGLVLLGQKNKEEADIEATVAKTAEALKDVNIAEATRLKLTAQLRAVLKENAALENQIKIDKVAEQIRDQGRALGLTAMEQERLNDQIRIEKAVRDLTGEAREKAIDQLTRETQKLQALREEGRTFASGFENAIKRFQENATNAALAGETVVESTFAGLDQITDQFFKGQDQSWRAWRQTIASTLASVASDLAKFAARQAALGLLKFAIGAFGGGAGVTAAAAAQLGTSAGVDNYSAKGNAFWNGVRFLAQGGILNGPTLFEDRRGNMNVAGEAGSEAVMPLARTRDGDLGVRMIGSGGGNTIVVNAPVTVAMQGDGRQGSAAGGLDPAASKMFGRAFQGAMEEFVRNYLSQQMRAGGLLNPNRFQVQ